MLDMKAHKIAIAALVAGVALAGGCSSGKRAARNNSTETTIAPTATTLSFAGKTMAYPDPRRVDHYDTYHGVRVHDPYRWLEDPDSPETRAWIDAENELTFAYLNSIPNREEIEDRLTELWNYEKFGVPMKRGGRYFMTRNSGLQNQSVLYVSEYLNGDERVLLDPNTFSDDGTVSLGGYSVSPDGNYIAYATSDGGSDWRTWKVRNVNTGEDLPDVINWSKFSGASWNGNSTGFFYSRYEAPRPGNELEGSNYNQKLYFHEVGTPQTADELVYQRPDHKEWGFSGSVTDDGDFLIITVWEGTSEKNRVFYKDLRTDKTAVVELLRDADASYDFIGNEGETFFFKSDFKAPRSRVIAIDINRPARSGWKQVVAESDETLQGVSLVGGKLIASYLDDAHTAVKVFDTNGQFVRDVELPGLGSAFGFGGEADDPETFFAFSSFTTPSTIFHYDVASGIVEEFRSPEVNFDPDDYETRQVFYTSKDGTKIPMFITAKKGVRMTGMNPTLLYGYGGFNISLTPSFNVANLVWLEMGGVYAQPNLRGGGEYGEKWHQAGMKLNKQNVFDDFIAAAEWLIDNNWTSPDHLAISGGSNGGLLVGACMVQRPDLFGAALPAVGVMDMLRFNQFTIGWAWESDYGSPENQKEFQALYSYSPYHNLKKGVAYPATMVTTADHDDRVVPAHSFKFAAALQNANSGPEPMLIRIETRAGHGAGTPTSKQIEQAADKWAFLAQNLGMNN
jgi:prolyl oligopeptidase